MQAKMTLVQTETVPLLPGSLLSAAKAAGTKLRLKRPCYSLLCESDNLGSATQFVSLLRLNTSLLC